MRLQQLRDGRKAIADVESLPGEDWKILPYNINYAVSNIGRVYGPNGFRTLTTTNGYSLLVVWADGKNRAYLLHRLVCELFNGPAPINKQIVLHRDHNKANCASSNLYWGTHKENTAEMLKAGRGSFGEKNPQSKLSWADIRSIRKRFDAGETTWSIANSYKQVSPQTVNNIANRRTWKEPANA